MTLSSNGKSGHRSVVAKANSGALSTGLWNAIDTDAVDTDRSQAGTLPQLLAMRSAGSRKRAPLGANSALPAARFLLLRYCLNSGATFCLF